MRSHLALAPTVVDGQTERKIAQDMLAMIPNVPDDTSLFLQNETQDPWNECYSAHASWDELSNPITSIPDDHIGLDNLRKIAEKNYATVIPYNPPVQSVNLLKFAHQLLAAGPVIYTKPGARRKNLSGLVLHPGNSTLTAHVRGEANPHLGYGRQHGGNKWWEWQFVSRIDPTVMPKTITTDELSVWTSPILAEIRDVIRDEMNNIACHHTSQFTWSAMKAVFRYVDIIFTDLRQTFPEGAFIKPVESSCSGDFGKLITTNDTNIYDVAHTFSKDMPSILLDLTNPQTIDSRQLRLLLLSKSSPICLIVHDLLFNPKEVIAQKALSIAKTAIGCNFEVRVDFLQGKSIRSMMRYCLADYYPREVKAAADFLDHFFEKAGHPERMLCGGADLALDQDGKWHIIEFNLGNESIGLKLGTYWSCYVSNLLGKKTGLISLFETIFTAPLSEQQKFLVGLEDTVLNHPDVDDLNFVYLWFHNRYCELFASNPTEEMRDQVLDKLTRLFGILPMELDGYITALIASARSYMARELAYFSTPDYQAPSAKKNFALSKDHQSFLFHDYDRGAPKRRAIPVKYSPTLFAEAATPVKVGEKRRHTEEAYTKRRLA